MGDTIRNRTLPLDESTASPPPPPACVYYAGCPGCAMERKKGNNTGIPYKELFFVGITTLSSALPVSSLFPFLYFMIEDMRVAENKTDIGLYAGLLGASYMAGRCFASIFWGVVADRIGRKPIIAFSLFTVVIFNTLFGLSTKYWMAITTRMLLGSLNGMLAPIKAYSVEVCRPEHHALGLSIVSTGWGIGLVIGPSIGGFLAQPAKQYPNLFSEKSIFGRFPYFLPCLCISLVALVVLISCTWLPILALWAVSDKSYGGLSLASKDVGQILAVSGAGLLAYQLLVYTHVHRYLGSIISSRIAAALSIPLLAAYPFMSQLSGTRFGLAIYFATILKGTLATTILTGTCILQNNAVPQNQRGAANGISTTAMSLFKAIAPAGAGALGSYDIPHFELSRSSWACAYLQAIPDRTEAVLF